jgi:hypothetical protein
VKPPVGVMPLRVWRELLPEPSPRQITARERAVIGAVARRWVAGAPVPPAWLAELGLPAVVRARGEGGAK